MIKRKKILLCILNWGLGHATRCIPIIHELQNQGAEVALASDGRAAQLLQQEFPNLIHYALPAYNVHYRTDNMFLNIAPQLFKIAQAIRLERKEIKRLIQTQEFDCIISDNRFGCFDKETYSVFITHQIKIKIPFRPIESIVTRFNQLFIRQFNECWVPDNQNKPNLSGELSHDIEVLHLRYLGVLSRLKKQQGIIKYDVAAILSGPEPQRSILEEKIIHQAQQLRLRTLIVQGKTEEKKRTKINDHIDLVSFMTKEELQQAFAETELLLSRSGYTTILDLAKTGKRAILIPTPGQTEQEYLAKNLMQQGIFFSQRQNDFNLKGALTAAKEYTGFGESFSNKNQLDCVIKDLLQRL